MAKSPVTPIHVRRYRQRQRRISALVGITGLALVAVVLWPRTGHVAPPAAPPPQVTPTKSVPAVAQSAVPQPAADDVDVITRATLRAPETVPYGTPLKVFWTGPDNPADFITLVRPDAPAGTYGLRQPTKAGWKLAFPAPEESGPWEIRYIAGRAKQILARMIVTVRPRTADLTAPDQAILGTSIVVKWTTPIRPGDCLAIVSRDAADGVFGSATSVSAGPSVELAVPTEPGDAEIRYMTKDHQVIGRAPLAITIPITTLSAPDEVTAGTTFEVAWNGPNSPGDKIALVAPQRAATAKPISAPTASGSPLQLRAPRKTGRAELRYVAGSNGLVFARRPIRVVPAR